MQFLYICFCIILSENKVTAVIWSANHCRQVAANLSELLPASVEGQIFQFYKNVYVLVDNIGVEVCLHSCPHFTMAMVVFLPLIEAYF
jgi:hypothetical protein